MKSLDPERFGYSGDSIEIPRESLGEEVDIYYFRMKLIHVLIQDPSLAASAYLRAQRLFEEEFAERVESTGLEEFFEDEVWELDEGERERVLRNVISGNESVLMRRFGLGLPVSVSFPEDGRGIRIRVSESLESFNLPRLRRPLCFFLAGFLAGVASGRFGEYVAFEEECLAEGDEYCVFFIGPRTPFVGRMRNYLDLPIDKSSTFPSVTKSMMRGAGRSPDYSILKEHFANTTLRALQYLGGEARPELGKRFHAFLLQQHNLGMLEGSPEAEEGLDRAGRRAGESLARIGLASGIPPKEMVAMLPELLMRIGMGMTEFYRVDGGYEVEVEECAESCGLEHGEEVCFFETGLFAGFFEYLEAAEIEAEEVRCSASGSGSCLHRLELQGEGNLDLTEILEGRDPTSGETENGEGGGDGGGGEDGEDSAEE